MIYLKVKLSLSRSLKAIESMLFIICLTYSLQWCNGWRALLECRR